MMCMQIVRVDAIPKVNNFMARLCLHGHQIDCNFDRINRNVSGKAVTNFLTTQNKYVSLLNSIHDPAFAATGQILSIV